MDVYLLLGICPAFDKPGCKKVRFAPYFDTSERITSASGHYDTDYGRITVGWKKVDKCYFYEVSAPLEIECEFEFDQMKVLNCSNENGRCYFELIEE